MDQSLLHPKVIPAKDNSIVKIAVEMPILPPSGRATGELIPSFVLQLFQKWQEGKSKTNIETWKNQKGRGEERDQI